MSVIRDVCHRQAVQQHAHQNRTEQGADDVRLAGADFVLFPSPYGSVALEREQALGIARALTDEQEPFARAFPVPSAGIHPGLVPLLVRDFGLDSVVNAGGGIHGHPDGAIGGGKAFRAAIDAALVGRPLREAAKDNEALQKAIDRWGAIEVEA